jgi:N utilization substance protein B
VTTRREARRTALDLLYQADVTGAAPAAVLGEWVDYGREIAPFTRELVEGVVANLPAIDAILESHADEWTVARMTALDRTILRLAVFELLHRPDVPPAAVISEAVEAASELSADESKAFVNGILGKLARELDAGAAS